jgi:uncharacterized RDD family membrane protein YckC
MVNQMESARGADMAATPAPVYRRGLARIVDAIGLLGVFWLLMQSIPRIIGYSEDGTGAGILAILITLSLTIAYEVISIGWKGRSLGKAAFKLRVIRLDTGRPGYREAALRALIPSLLLLILAIPLYPVPYLIAAILPGHRWPNDSIAGTRVVSSEHAAEG